MSLEASYHFRWRVSQWGIRCLLGLVAAAGILALRLALVPMVGLAAPTLLFILAVMVAAWLGNWLAGAIASLAGGLLAVYLLMEPVWVFSFHKPGALTQLIMFYLVSGLVITLVEGFKRAGQRTHDSEQFQHAVLNALMPEMAVLDQQGRIMAVNEAWKRFARENGEPMGRLVAVGTNYLEVCRCASDQKDELARQALEGIESVLRGRRTQFTLEYPCHKPGELRWFLMSVVPLSGEGGGGAVVSHINVTQRKADELERVQLLSREQSARAEAEAANRAKDDFLATLSHELRTPLTAIMGWAQMLLRTEPDAEEVRHGLEVIERNASAQSQIIDDLLDVSRIIRGKLHLEAQPVDLAEVVDASVDSVRLAMEAKGLELVKQVDQPVGQISGDRNRLQQVMWNLLTNAIKFTPEGGRIQIRLSQHDGHARLGISDSGIGIKPDFLPFMFERFRQADSSSKRRYGGLGLGLAIVRHLVELHGGTVWAESGGEGKGATFVVDLPLAATAGDATLRPIREFTAEEIFTAEDAEDRGGK